MMFIVFILIFIIGYIVGWLLGSLYQLRKNNAVLQKIQSSLLKLQRANMASRWKEPCYNESFQQQGN